MAGGPTAARLSMLNAPTGTVTSNMALRPAGTGGDITVIATDPTHLIVDIMGYFAPRPPGRSTFSP